MFLFRMALHWQILLAMVVGAAVGVAVNATAGRRSTGERIEIRRGSLEVYGMKGPIKVPAGGVWILDTPSQILMEIDSGVEGEPDVTRRRIVVRDQLSRLPENWPRLPPEVDQEAIERLVAPTLSVLKEADPAAYALFQLHGRSRARKIGDWSQAVGDLFLRMLKMVSVPLIITSLITGVTGLGHAERLGRMFGRTILYYLSTSMLAIGTGLLMVNLIQPGNRNAAPPPPPPPAPQAQIAPDAAPPAKPAKQREGKDLGTVLFEQLENMIPPNPVAAVAEGNFLSIISFSLLFGIFTILVGGRVAKLISEFFEAAFEVIMRMTMAIIHLAPIGVLFLMLSATAGQGIAVFGTLGWYMFTVTLALLIHAVVVMPAILHFVAKRNPAQYAKAMSPALLTAFSSASSNGTLPLTMTCAEERAGVSNRVTSFVLPLGATVNMDGTALYEVVAVLFIAQLTPDVQLTFADQLIVSFTALLASVGAAGIPHAGLIMMVIILQAVGLPTESQGLIIAVDRVLDMARTSVNVWSDSCGCAVVSRFEAES